MLGGSGHSQRLTGFQDLRRVLAPIAALEVTHVKFSQRTDLWRPNKLPRSSDTSCLGPPSAVESHVPSLFDHVLQLEDCGHPFREMLVTGALGFVNIRNKHLDVPIAAEPALAWYLADMAYFGATEKSAPNGFVLLAQLGKNGNEIVCFIFHRRVFCQFTIRGDLGLFRCSAAFLQHLSEPRGHFLLMGMGSQLRALTTMSVHIHQAVKTQ